MYFLFSMKTFARCVWSEGDDKKEEEATILGSWVNEEEKTMRWPTKINVIRALMEQRDPEPHWKTFKLLKVKLRSSKYLSCFCPIFYFMQCFRIILFLLSFLLVFIILSNLFNPSNFLFSIKTWSSLFWTQTFSFCNFLQIFKPSNIRSLVFKEVLL